VEGESLTVIMGMIQAMIKKVPDGKTSGDYMREVEARMPEYAEGAEGHTIELITAATFEKWWADQENLKREKPIEEKYKALAAEGRVIGVEIDW
jgi:predicted thioredoxin/glutaredoxin